MANYGSTAGVQARIPARTIGASSAPTSTQVGTLLDQVEASLDGRLAAIGLTTPVTGTNPIAILAMAVNGKVASQAYLGKLTVDDEGGGGDRLLTELTKEWDELMDLIRTSPAIVASMLGQAYGSTAGASQLRSFPTDNDEGLSRSNGDFEPVITRKKEW